MLQRIQYIANADVELYEGTVYKLLKKDREHYVINHNNMDNLQERELQQIELKAHLLILKEV